jgi:hypothetical protein
MAVPYTGCLTPKALDPTSADRKAIVTIEGLMPSPPGRG